MKVLLKYSKGEYYEKKHIDEVVFARIGGGYDAVLVCLY
jgi:hypothetical protein